MLSSTLLLALTTLSSLSSSLAAPPRTPAKPSWALTNGGVSGVSAMQLSIVSPTLALVLDKAENNALQTKSGKKPAFGSLYNLKTAAITPLDINSNTFCAGGTTISNGTMVSMGGNGAVNPDEYGDSDGWMGIRLFGPCANANGVGCKVFEDPANIHLVESRWYPSAIRIPDGSAMVIGGSYSGGFYNYWNIPSYEYFPSKNGNTPTYSPFLDRTQPANLFPIAFLLPNGNIFMSANNQSIIYNPTTDTETLLPDFPNGVRVTYPFSGTGALLPLSPPNYTPEVLICGGSSVDDNTDPGSISAQTPASNLCFRMVLNSAGIRKGWQVEQMLEGRIMPNAVQLPNGQLVIVNGGTTGVAGYGNVYDQIGQSNSDNPAFTPSLYTPTDPSGSRFANSFMPTSSIARLYHSVATLTPMGNIMIAGSNPNADVSTDNYPTEYRVEFLNPPYMNQTRPTMNSVPTKLGYGSKVSIPVTIPSGLTNTGLQVALMDLGFTTHAINNSARLVFLVASLSSDKKTLTITGPPNQKIYPPGVGYVYLTINGVTSVGVKVMVGSGANPPQV